MEYLITFKLVNGNTMKVIGNDVRELIDQARALIEAQHTVMYDLSVQIVRPQSNPRHGET